MRRIICGLRKATCSRHCYNGFLIPFLFGGHSELVPRLPIPNRTVKRLCADDSVDYPCESRSPPNSPFQSPDAQHQGFVHFKSKEYSNQTEHHHAHSQCLLSPLLPQRFKASINVSKAACKHLKHVYRPYLFNFNNFKTKVATVF